LLELGPTLRDRKFVAQDAASKALHCSQLDFDVDKIHKSLRVTPATQAGLSEHVWSLEEIAKLAD
jgi:hypothetical protein